MNPAARTVTIDVNSAVATANDGVKILRSTAAALFARRLLSGGADRATGLLPPAVRWISGNGRVVLLEQPPRRHTLIYRVRTGEGAPKVERFPLQMPWMLWLFIFADPRHPLTVALGARPASLTNLDDDIVWRPTLPNLGYRGALCLPGDLELPPWTATIGDAVSHLVATVWSSEFNNDIALPPRSNKLDTPTNVDDAWVAWCTENEHRSVADTLAAVDDEVVYGTARTWVQNTIINTGGVPTPTQRLLQALE